MHSDCQFDSILESMQHDGWISEVLYEVKSGKEATVFCCAGGVCSPIPLLAAKIFRPIETRQFKNDAMYQGGRMHMARNSRVRRAMNKKSEFGRKVQYATWVNQEWEILNTLYNAGADVPEPLYCADQAILMPFLGDEDGASPMLHETSPDRATASRIINAVLRNVELMLDRDCVHGDLSPYNIMYHNHKAIIIDFPQATDPRLNQHGFELLSRDIERVCDWAARYGANRDAYSITQKLWGRFRYGDLG